MDEIRGVTEHVSHLWSIVASSFFSLFFSQNKFRGQVSTIKELRWVAFKGKKLVDLMKCVHAEYGS